jgi:hypothetical protein
VSHLPEKNAKEMDKVRLRAALIRNTLESVSLAAKHTDDKFLIRGRSKYQTPFRMLLFALTLRCDRLFEESIRYAEQARDVGADAKAFDAAGFLVLKRGQLLRARSLLQDNRFRASMGILDKLMEDMGRFEKELETE